MKKIKYIMIAALFLLSGCTAEYNLNITNDGIEESFESAIYKSEIPNKTQSDVELDDPITPFIEQDQYPFKDNTKIVYEKQIEEEDDYRLVKYNYNYSFSDFKKSTTLNKCFEKHKYLYDDNVVFSANGSFYCLYSDELNINIKTNNKVLSHNADSVSGNTYTWTINKKNVDDINIKIEIERNSLSKFITKYIVLIVIIGIVVIGLLGFLIIRFKKHSNNKF